MRTEYIDIPAGQWVEIIGEGVLVGFEVVTDRSVKMHLSGSSVAPSDDAPYINVQSYMPGINYSGVGSSLGLNDHVWLRSDEGARVAAVTGASASEANDFILSGVMQGRSFSVATGNQTIPQGSRLKMELYNPPGSGVRLVVHRGIFSNDRQGQDQMLVRGGRPAFGAPLIPEATPIPRIRLNNNPNVPYESKATSTFVADNSAPITNQAVGENLALNGVRTVNEVIFVLYPGNGFVYEIEGQSGLTTDPARASIALNYIEQDWI